MSAIVNVLTNHALLHHVAQFQQGIPRALYDFWRRIEPAQDDGQVAHSNVVGNRLAFLLSKKGDLRLLSLTREAVWYSRRYGTRQTICADDLMQSSIEEGRVDMMTRLGDKMDIKGRPLPMWQVALDCTEETNLTVMTFLLQRFPLSINGVGQLKRAAEYGSSRWSSNLVLLLWLHDHVDMPLPSFSAAVSFNNLAMVKFLHETKGDSHRCPPEAFLKAWERTNVEILLYLLENRWEDHGPELEQQAKNYGDFATLAMIHTVRGLRHLDGASLDGCAGA